MAPADTRTDPTHEVVDPVCGEVFPPELAVFQSVHAGRKAFFCSSTCKETFDAAPDAHPLHDAPPA